MEYQEIENQILKVLETTMFCVFASANNKGEVDTAQMTMVNDGLNVYLQTDKTFEKIANIQENENVAINCGAYNFKGKARIVGQPTTNSIFIEKLKKKHLKTYEHYSNLPNEVLIEVVLTECKIWGIDNNKDIHNQETITIVNLIDKTFKNIICDKM